MPESSAKGKTLIYIIALDVLTMFSLFIAIITTLMLTITMISRVNAVFNSDMPFFLIIFVGIFDSLAAFFLCYVPERTIHSYGISTSIRFSILITLFIPFILLVYQCFNLVTINCQIFYIFIGLPILIIFFTSINIKIAAHKSMFSRKSYKVILRAYLGLLNKIMHLYSRNQSDN